MMTKPLIGITCSSAAAVIGGRGAQDRLNCAYSRAVWEAGGAPVVVPNLPEAAEPLAARLDGLLLSGGADWHPSRYGEETLENGTVEVDAARDDAEAALVSHWLDGGKPLLAICRGIQTLNVLMGGTLWQDLPAQHPTDVLHRQAAPRSEATHRIRIATGSRLGELVGDAPWSVNSLHHQAIRELAAGLTASAWADDGVVEAVEGKDPAFLVAVQFHPEELTGWCERSRALFRAFTRAAMNRLPVSP